ncbi:outer membrane protein transport protein [Enterovirga sp.]|uniref:OmpP1/FadL family transporter n=1 Tax=Enterovirga sp. TaxID=2026350 RepID=UPI002BB0C017|nr:outer membrane protein transport protein [Enterovirga sp.]HMO30032.1 outer membrane protein transport protein [Enterovirga sp.]
MKKRPARSLILAGLSAAALGASSAAWAGGFALHEQGATGQGMSFAGVASGSGGLSSMYWNPATITMNPGFQSYSSVSLINLDAKITPYPGPGTPTYAFGPSGQLGEFGAVPASSFSYQLSDTVWLGMTMNAPFGLVTKPNYSWAGQVYGRTSKIFSANFNPIVGIKVTDWLSVAAGPAIEYIDVKLRRSAPFAGAPLQTAVLPNAPSATLRGDDVGVGYTLGATITPMDGTVIGIGYRSSISHGLKGSIISPTIPLPGNKVLIRSSLNTPDLLTIGLTQAVTPDFRVNIGYEFANWSRIGTIAQVAYGGPLLGPINNLSLRYKDGHFLSVGGEYDWSPQWTFRAGLAYEWSPISDSVRSVAVPDANRVWASIGASYRFSDKITIDLAYSHVFVKNGPIRINPGDPDYAGLPFNAVTKGQVDIVSAALRYRWDDPARPAPAAVVAKY